MVTDMVLSETERSALSFLLREGGSVLVSKIPDRNEKDIVFGTVFAGIPVYRKLEKKGLCYQTEEDEMEDGFKFTESIELTDLGKQFATL